ncbi:hypothetical protein MKW98_005163 [Papaver atlanticum]|uniref:Uncharacterized protein n=1 Tax=Papaver atlanticum TaxID=357466 RepID=A0AAD4RWA5_9MAGN|nr:hypothetical protein MKW98_005163 [Papaver atlanticum]
MASGQQQPSRSELDEKARQGETVVPGGTGGKTVEAQQNLAQGRSRGGQTRKEQLGTEGYQEMGRKGGRSSQSGGAAGGAAAQVSKDDLHEDLDVDESTM